MLKGKIKQVEEDENFLKIRKYDVESALLNAKCSLVFLSDMFHNHRQLWESSSEFYNGAGFILGILSEIVGSAYNQYTE